MITWPRKVWRCYHWYARYNSHWSLTEDTSVFIKRFKWALQHSLGWSSWSLWLASFWWQCHGALIIFEQGKSKRVYGSAYPWFVYLPDKLKNIQMCLDVLASRLAKMWLIFIVWLGRWWRGLWKGWDCSSRKTRVPILAMSMDNDHTSPHSDNQLVIFSDYGKAKKIKAKTITEGYEQSLELAIKWIEDELKMTFLNSQQLNCKDLPKLFSPTSQSREFNEYGDSLCWANQAILTIVYYRLKRLGLVTWVIEPRWHLYFWLSSVCVNDKKSWRRWGWWLELEQTDQSFETLQFGAVALPGNGKKNHCRKNHSVNKNWWYFMKSWSMLEKNSKSRSLREESYEL